MIVELMSVGEDLSEPMAAATNALNAVQTEFRFTPVPEARKNEGLTFEREAYMTSEVWKQSI